MYVKILGTTEDDARAQQWAGQAAHQGMIDALVANGKYLWQALQAGNGVGGNNNNNSNGVGGYSFDAAYCTQVMFPACVLYARDHAPSSPSSLLSTVDAASRSLLTVDGAALQHTMDQRTRDFSGL